MDVTAIIVNYNTLGLLQTAANSFTKYYPNIELIIVDNHSTIDELGTHMYMDACKDNPSRPCKTRLIYNNTNIGHGPAMHQAIQMVTTKYFYTLDTDTETFQTGHLEQMIRLLGAADNHYASGWLRWVNSGGISADWYVPRPNDIEHTFIPYIHPFAALYKTELYHKLTPFIHHGAPCIQNMIDAMNKGYKVFEFGISHYVRHLIGGTRRMYTGIPQGDWAPTDDNKPAPWNPKAKVPI